MKSRWEAKYHTIEREWYLWNGHAAMKDHNDNIRFFITAQDALAWLEANPDVAVS